MANRRATIDLVTGRADGAFAMVLVEEGPWEKAKVEENLRRIQQRLYDCVDIVVDGHLSAKYPQSRGRPVIVRLDCYDTPDTPVRDLLRRFAQHIRDSKEVQRDLAAGGHVNSIDFEYNWRRLRGRDGRRGAP
jgi:hypothetical protein